MDYSSMTDLLACPRMYQYGREEKLRIPVEGGNAALNFGTLWHSIHEVAFKLPKADPDEVVDAALAGLQWVDPVRDYRTADKARIAYKQWLKKWDGIPWDMRESEVKYTVDLGQGLEPHTGRYDGVVETRENNGDPVERWLVDFKTTAKMSMDWVTQYRISNQFRLYWASRSLLSPDTIAGVVVDLYCATSGVQKSKDEFEHAGNRFYRAFFRYEPSDLDEMYLDYAFAVRLRDMYREADYYPKNTGNCWRCAFTDICDTKDPELREALKEGYKK